MSTEPWLSVVIPTLDEASRIGPALQRLIRTDGIDEVVVCDGGSKDGTRQLAESVPGVRVIRCPRPGRGPQLNRGARHALGEALLFLHVDCGLPAGAVQQIRRTLRRPGVVAGAFRTRHVLDTAAPRWLKPILPLADLRSHYTRHPYGDQALFVRAEAFRRAGGFADVPLLEDVEFTRRLWDQGRIHILRDRVEVSARRYARHPWRSAVAMNTYPTLWRLGVSEATLARWYGNPR